MKMTNLLGGAMALAILSMASVASANDLGEDGAWQFRSSSQTQVLQNGLIMMEEQKAGLLSGGASGGTLGTNGTGLLGATTTGTNNFTEIVNETTNNCKATAAGAALSCGSGSVSGTVDQTSTGSPVTTTSKIDGNTLTNEPTTTTTNSNNGN